MGIGSILAIKRAAGIAIQVRTADITFRNIATGSSCWEREGAQVGAAANMSNQRGNYDQGREKHFVHRIYAKSMEFTIFWEKFEMKNSSSWSAGLPYISKN